MQARDRLIVAADLSTRDEILALADELHDVVGLLKIGSQAFVANGPALVREIVDRDVRVFLDLKLHDIPNTVQRAVAEAEKLDVAMLTVHASGGASMLRAAVSSKLLVLGVTVLTSLDDEELRNIGFSENALSTAVRLARLARESGLRGIVASPLEIRAIRDACGDELTIVAPGVRPAGSEAGDQRRTMTPRAAIAAGADYIVVGRPITEKKNRREAAVQIIDEIS
ncbi:MAG TPA: orotidine-5'-phosphate decarboxylase [Thermoanaerobaculia bacterium]|jgi:orotidine-5'-phosphate decarboxylase|nr:orotidine-5'-phosphate decarboxylase [Thermoanaerobaculia bacterium]